MGIEYAAPLSTLLAFLAARALVRPLSAKWRGAAFGVLATLGAATRAAIEAAARAGAFGGGDAAASRFISVWPQAILAAAATATLYFAAAGAFTTASGERSGRRGIAALAGAAELVIPAVLGLGLGLAMADRGAPVAIIAGAALTLAAALWTYSDADRVAWGFAAAALAAAAAVASRRVHFAPVAVALGVLAARYLFGRLSFATLSGLKAALTLGAAWAFSSAGLGWAGAGLVTGIADALVDWAARASGGPRDASRTSRRPSRASSRGPEDGAQTTIGAEAAYLLCFVAGFRLDIGAAAARLPWAAAAGAAFVTASALRAKALGEARPDQPAWPAALAIAVTALRAPYADAAAAGLAVAMLASVPLSGNGRRHGTPAEFSALVGVDPGHGGDSAAAFAASVGPESEPVRAACVAVGDPERGDGGAAKAEEAMVRCVVAGAAEGIHVLPSIISAADPAAGLAKAAADRRVDAVILGPIADMKGAERQGTLLSGVLKAHRGHVVALDRTEPFSGDRSLALAVFSGQELAQDFAKAVRAVVRAWGGSARSIVSVSIGGSAESLAAASGGALRKARISEAASWREAASAFESLAGGNKSFVVFSSRPGSSGWNPGHERFPAALAGAFPDSSITLWFLPEAGAAAGSETGRSMTADLAGLRPDAGSGEAVAQGDRAPKGDRAPIPAGYGAPSIDPALPPLLLSAYGAGRVMTGMTDEALVDAVRRLVQSIFPDDKASAGRLAADFSAVARREPIELSKGILLLHGYAGGVTMPELAIGARPEGWRLVALESPVRILVVLVSPSGSGPESHLAALTQIALAFRGLGLADRLLGGA